MSESPFILCNTQNNSAECARFLRARSLDARLVKPRRLIAQQPTGVFMALQLSSEAIRAWATSGFVKLSGHLILTTECLPIPNLYGASLTGHKTLPSQSLQNTPCSISQDSALHCTNTPCSISQDRALHGTNTACSISQDNALHCTNTSCSVS